MTYTHTCIKPGCGKTYKDDDPDPYYCPGCNAEKKAIAKRIDRKLGANRQEPHISPLQEYDALPKAHGFPIVKL